jgi:hypothetical protein
MDGGTNLSVLPVGTGGTVAALIRRAIESYSSPGELVIDPMCGSGATVVEAVMLGRRAIGVELDFQRASFAAGEAVSARSAGARGQALVMPGDARCLGHGLCDDMLGTAALVLTSARLASPGARAQILEACERMLAPDGHIVLVVRNLRQAPELVDLTQQLRAAA